MDLRFVAMITGCMLIGAGAAAYHRADGLFAASGATLASAPDVPLFLQAAVGAPTPAAWPSAGSVTFYDEMLALRTALATRQTPTPAPRVANVESGGEPTPPRAGTAPETNDTVEVVIRDRFGRPIRVERVPRRQLAGGGANPPVPPRAYGTQPYGPYGYPYRR